MSSVTQNSSYVSPKGPWAKLFMVLLGIAILFGSYRIYQHATSSRWVWTTFRRTSRNTG